MNPSANAPIISWRERRNALWPAASPRARQAESRGPYQREVAVEITTIRPASWAAAAKIAVSCLASGMNPRTSTPRFVTRLISRLKVR